MRRVGVLGRSKRRMYVSRFHMLVDFFCPPDRSIIVKSERVLQSLVSKMDVSPSCLSRTCRMVMSLTSQNPYLAGTKVSEI